MSAPGWSLPTGKDHRGRIDRKTTRQRAETAECALLVRAEELITPSDRRVHRLLALREIAWAGRREQDIMRESAKQLLNRQHLDPGSRQFERERQCIEPPANRCHGRTVRGREAKVGLHVLYPLHEESHRGSARRIRR